MPSSRWRSLLPFILLFCTVLSLHTPAAANEGTPIGLPTAETPTPTDPAAGAPPALVADATAGDGSLPSLTITNNIYLPLLFVGSTARTASVEAESVSVTPPFQRAGDHIVYTSETTDPAAAGYARYRLNIDRAGSYVLKMQVDAPSTSANSVFVGINVPSVTTSHLWSIAPTVGFEAREVGYDGEERHVFELSAGAHTLTIAGRERDVRLDRVWMEPAAGLSDTPSGPKLGAKYGPPTLNNPKTVTISNANPSYYGDGDEDVIVRVAEKMLVPVKLGNVRNLVLIGGEFTIGDPLTSSLPNVQDSIRAHRALAFSEISGTLYVEGIYVNNSGGGLTEIMQVWSTPGDVIIRNSRFEGVRTKPGDTEFDFNHPDLLQPMSGRIVLENVTLTDSDYQGLFIGQESGQSLSSLTFRNVNTSKINRQAWYFADLRDGVVKGCENCWHNPAGSRWPDDPVYAFMPKPRQSGSSVVWDNHPAIARGMTIRLGTPANGDFVPASQVGRNYDRSFFQ